MIVRSDSPSEAEGAEIVSSLHDLDLRILDDVRAGSSDFDYLMGPIFIEDPRLGDRAATDQLTTNFLS